MSEVEVRIPTPLQPYSGGQRALAAEAATIGELLDNLAADHPSLVQQVRGRDGTLRPYVNLFVHQTDIRETGGLDTPLADGDEVIIMPSVAGG